MRTSAAGLLALNASIEAARAGEAGNGFAVVARSDVDLASREMLAIIEGIEALDAVVRAAGRPAAATPVGGSDRSRRRDPVLV